MITIIRKIAGTIFLSFLCCFMIAGTAIGIYNIVTQWNEIWPWLVVFIWLVVPFCVAYALLIIFLISGIKDIWTK